MKKNDFTKAKKQKSKNKKTKHLLQWHIQPGSGRCASGPKCVWYHRDGFQSLCLGKTTHWSYFTRIVSYEIFIIQMNSWWSTQQWSSGEDGCFTTMNKLKVKFIYIDSNLSLKQEESCQVVRKISWLVFQLLSLPTSLSKALMLAMIC